MFKRTNIDEFNNIRANGKKAINLKDDDELISVSKTNGECDIMMASSNGRLVRFNESSVRPLGRSAAGVKGINVDGGFLVRMETVENSNSHVLVMTENGYGKRTPVSEYRLTNRGGKGVKTLNITEKNGSIISFEILNSFDKDLLIVTNEGIIIRIDVNQVSVLSRVTQGVRLIHLKDNQIVSSVTLIDKESIEVESDISSVESTEATEEEKIVEN